MVDENKKDLFELAIEVLILVAILYGLYEYSQCIDVNHKPNLENLFCFFPTIIPVTILTALKVGYENTVPFIFIFIGIAFWVWTALATSQDNKHLTGIAGSIFGFGTKMLTEKKGRTVRKKTGG